MKKLFLSAFAAVCLWTASASAPAIEAGPNSQGDTVLLAKAGETGV